MLPEHPRICCRLLPGLTPCPRQVTDVRTTATCALGRPQRRPATVSPAAVEVPRRLEPLRRALPWRWWRWAQERRRRDARPQAQEPTRALGRPQRRPAAALPAAVEVPRRLEPLRRALPWRWWRWAQERRRRDARPQAQEPTRALRRPRPLAKLLLPEHPRICCRLLPGLTPCPRQVTDVRTTATCALGRPQRRPATVSPAAVEVPRRLEPLRRALPWRWWRWAQERRRRDARPQAQEPTRALGRPQRRPAAALPAAVQMRHRLRSGPHFKPANPVTRRKSPMWVVWRPRQLVHRPESSLPLLPTCGIAAATTARRQ